MGFTKKTWKNRIAEYINRRLITMEDGSTNLVTVARDEGTISQEGDAFNAVNMNDLEDRIEAGFADVTQSLTAENGTKFRFGQNSEGKYGYIVNKDGADTVIPFKNGECKLLGRYSGNKTISLESLGYPNATKDNFLVLIDSIPSPNKMEYFINFQNNYYTQFGVTAQSPSWAVNGTNLVVAGMYINGYLKNTYEQNNINLVTSTSAYSWRLYYIS